MYRQRSSKCKYDCRNSVFFFFVHSRILRNVHTHARSSKCYDKINDNNKNVNETRRSIRMSVVVCTLQYDQKAIVRIEYGVGRSKESSGKCIRRAVLYNMIRITLYPSGLCEIVLHCLSKYNYDRRGRRVFYSILIRATFIRLA
jgi:hypothetical protein